MEGPRVVAPFTSLHYAPLGSFGAELRGVDLSAPIGETLARQLRQALATSQVLAFPGQHLTPAALLNFTECLGSPEPSFASRPASHQVAGFPGVLHLHNRPGSATTEYGMSWHSDGLAYACVPHGATVLSCLACPKGRGDTLFASQVIALAALPATLREAISGLSWLLPHVPFSEVPVGRALAQPMVRIHPQTGQAFLFCAPNAQHLRHHTAAKSEAILRAIRPYQTCEAAVLRYRWQPGDLVVWENCALLHNRADDVDHDAHGLREMMRTATAGSFSAVECEAASNT